MKKIIFFENLDKLNFYFSLILIPIYKKIYFRNASYAEDNNFFKKNLNKFFFRIGLSGLGGQAINKSYILKKFLIKKFIRNNFNNIFFSKFGKLTTVDNNTKIIFTLENYLYNSNYLIIDTSSYICIKSHFKNNDTIYYFPSSKKTFSLISEIKNKDIKIIRIILFITEFNLLLKKAIQLLLKKRFLNNRTKKHVHEKTKNFREIGYFPHEGLKYGNFFKKNFFYKNDKKSKLYKDNIETLSFKKFDPLTKKFLNFFKLKYSNIDDNTEQFKISYFLKYIIFFFKNRKFIKKNFLINFFVFLEIYLSTKKYDLFLKKKKFKFLFFYNDFLIPTGFLLASEINNIKTISFQDRLLSYFYYHRCFFDLYLTAGDEFKKILKSKFLIKKFKTLGLTRADFIKNNKVKFLENIKNLGIYDEIITCLLIGYREDDRVDLYGEVGNSESSILNFLNDIKKLAIIFKNKYFVIQFKLLDYKKYPELLKKINNTIYGYKNLILITDKTISSASLVGNSNLVIGKYSTILDEALVKNKNVIIHDPENWVSTFGFYRKNKFLIAKNYDELLFKLTNLLNKKGDFYDDYINKKNHYVNKYLTNDGIVGNQDKITEFIERFISNED